MRGKGGGARGSKREQEVRQEEAGRKSRHGQGAKSRRVRERSITYQKEVR